MGRRELKEQLSKYEGRLLKYEEFDCEIYRELVGFLYITKRIDEDTRKEMLSRADVVGIGDLRTLFDDRRLRAHYSGLQRGGFH